MAAKRHRGAQRTVRADTLRAAREHITAAGEVIYAANLLQDAFFKVFLVALSLERPDEFGASIRFHSHALTIWHVVLADKSQREMAFKAISTVPTKLNLKKALPRLKWAKDHADTLADYRNVVAHSPVLFRGRPIGGGIVSTPMFAAHGMRPVHARRLKLIDGLAFWRVVRDDLLNLSDYVEGVRTQIDRFDVESRGGELISAPKSWPRRPLLRSLPRLREIARILSREEQPPKRRTRRRPLLG